MGTRVGDTIYDSVTDQDYDVEFVVTTYGTPPHMGSLTYPGDPSDPPEIETHEVYVADSQEVIYPVVGPLSIPTHELIERLEQKILQGVAEGRYNPEPPEID